MSLLLLSPLVKDGRGDFLGGVGDGMQFGASPNLGHLYTPRDFLFTQPQLRLCLHARDFPLP